jgi:hypothetical protein
VPVHERRLRGRLGILIGVIIQVIIIVVEVIEIVVRGLFGRVLV